MSGKALSPVDARALSWLAFARGCLDAQQLPSSAPDVWDSAAFTATACSLASQPPFAAAWRELGVQVHDSTGSLALRRQSMSAGHAGPDASAPHHMQVLHCSVPLAELPTAIRGAVVGLAVGPQQQQPAYRHTLNSPADAAPQPCLGLGIVRSLDTSAGVVYLLTPLSEAELQLVNVLQVRLFVCQCLTQDAGTHRVVNDIVVVRSLKIFTMLAGGSPESSAGAGAGAGAPVSLPGTLFVDIRCKRFALNEEPRESAAGSAPVAVRCSRGCTEDSAGASECLATGVCSMQEVASDCGKLNNDRTGDCHIS